MKNGVPWSEAWAMDAEERLAAAVIFGQFEGGVFNWTQLRWNDRA